MAVGQCMDIMLKDLEHFQKKVTDDFEKYSKAVAALEEKKRKLKEKQQNLLEYESFFALFQSVGARAEDSVHCMQLQQEAALLVSEIPGEKENLKEQNVFYGAFSAGEFEKLWESEEVNCQLAAIYCGFEKARNVFERTKIFFEKKQKLSEPVARFLVEQAIAYSEKSIYTEEDRAKLDELLRQILWNTEGKVCSGISWDEGEVYLYQSDSEWQTISGVLNLRLYNRVLAECENMLEKFRKERDAYADFSQNWEDTKKRLGGELEHFDTGKAERSTRQYVGEVQKWWRDSVQQLERQLAEQAGERRRFDAVIRALGDSIQELKGIGEDEILEPFLREVQGRLLEYQTVFEGLERSAVLEAEQGKLLREYQRRVNTLQGQIRDEMSKQAEKATQKARRKAERKQNRRERKLRRKERKRQWRRAHPILNIFRIVFWFNVYTRLFSMVLYLLSRVIPDFSSKIYEWIGNIL